MKPPTEETIITAPSLRSAKWGRMDIVVCNAAADGGFDQCLQLLLVPHVTGVGERRPAGGVDLRRGCLATLGLAARDDDARAVQRHLRRDRLADAAARAGDEGYLARQVEHAHVERPPAADLPCILPAAPLLGECARRYSSPGVRSRI